MDHFVNVAFRELLDFIGVRAVKKPGDFEEVFEGDLHFDLLAEGTVLERGVHGGEVPAG